ncbi:PEPxxWA-CTERM sorting domain-containing protein [Phenylobacterium sp.]|uniref:PEPxxWA-CTERM sorting domain-containing protein n=1 Tax=Phenylobacterium sp. TaxID=1871053 RepID=UPI0025FF88B7|nr:PEPxxWA-CTERM sorting domain-containing protein [Phenylobacterium sp.]MBX3484732.1 PEP-CTERM sorting domain-containing protein [Phenylobacterium sp.]
MPKVLAAAATAAAVSLVAATPASATQTIYVEQATMNTTFQANISGVGAVYSNGVTFRVNDLGTAATYNYADYYIYGFCIDIFHQITINTTLNYTYTSTYGDSDQPLYTNYGPTAPDNELSDAQILAITNLVDTGWLLHQADPSGADTLMRTAAIQAAIWQVANPTRTVTVRNNNLDAGQYAQYQSYFNDYVAGNYTVLADANDRVYTITDQGNPAHQTFAIGWPIDGVPEPGTWALMILGFGAAGAMLRRQRKIAAAA